MVQWIIKMSVSKISKIPLALLAVFFFCLPCLAQSPEYGDAIVVASIGDARSLVPILASDSASSDVCGLVFNGLVKYDKNINIVGDLAEGWVITDGGRKVVFNLKKGIKWHDGAPFTSRDVAFTYEKLIDPKVKTPYGSDFGRIESLSTPDDYTVIVNYKEPFSPALSSWGMWIMPEHLLKNEDLNSTSFGRHPIGTGPYKFKSWQTGEKIELISNPNYFEGMPYVGRYIYRIIPDDATIFLELETGGVDMSILTPLQFTRQTDTPSFRSKYNKFRYPGFGYTYMGYNLSDPRFSDIKVRKAIDYAINKEEIVKTIFFGLGRVITGPFIADSWAYNKSVSPLAYDPARAKELLKDAGWLDTDGDGWIEKGGREFEFTILINQGNNERLRSAEMIQSYLLAVGIRVKIRTLEWSALINEFINKKKFDAVLMGWFLPRDPDCYDIWHSSRTREGEFNFIGYKNDEVDRLLEEGRRIFDQKARADIYNSIHALINADSPCLFLYSSDALPIVSKRFHGVEVSPVGIGYNFIKWYVPKEEQKYK